MLEGTGMIARAVWLVSFGLVSLLWFSGAWLFARSGLARRRKVAWTFFLLGIGAVVGLLLPLDGIRDRFLIVLALVPVLALIDIRLAKSNRTFSFWLRACSFEVCTVFAFAALTRFALNAW
jgi:hypothetical protein